MAQTDCLVATIMNVKINRRLDNMLEICIGKQNIPFKTTQSHMRCLNPRSFEMISTTFLRRESRKSFIIIVLIYTVLSQCTYYCINKTLLMILLQELNFKSSCFLWELKKTFSFSAFADSFQILHPHLPVLEVGIIRTMNAVRFDKKYKSKVIWKKSF